MEPTVGGGLLVKITPLIMRPPVRLWVKVWLADSILPTPALSWQVKDYAAAGGVMITASHNPGEYNGLKFKASYGGSASPEIIVEIEECIRLLEASGRTFSNVAMSSAVEYFAPRASYLEHVKAMLNQKTMASFKEKIVFDVMYGAAMGYPSELAKSYGLDMVEVHSEFNPSFGGINLEPIEKNLAALRRQPLHQSPSDYGPPDKIFCRETRMVRRRRADADGIRTGEADGTKVRPETLRNTGWL